MVWEKDRKTGTALWLLAGGIVVGLAAAVYLGMRSRRRRTASPPELRALEKAVIHALRHDALLRHRGIDVSAVAAGIIELTGTVESENEAHHAVAVVQSVTGVRTVLNRLDAEEAEQRMRPRARRAGESASGSRWYGMNVGMGRRRQSPQTDPAQRDDRADLVDQALTPKADEALADLAQERVEKRALEANEMS